MALRPRPPRGLYQLLGAFAVRAPLLPIDRYLALSDEADQTGETAAPDRDRLVRAAICVASPTLSSVLDRTPRDHRSEAAMHSSLLRYLIRMSTRPTPFGLFAGVGIGVWDAATDLRIDSGPRPIRTRPDMGWLTRVVLAAERDANIRSQLRLVSNTCAFQRNGRLHLSDRATGSRAGQPDVSIRATPVVRRVLARAHTPVAYADLVAAVLAATPGATVEQVGGLVDELWQQDLLLSDLRPPLTGDPVLHVVRRLAVIPSGRQTADRLACAVEQAAKIDHDPAGMTANGGEAVTALRGQIRSVTALDTPDSEDVVQVDSALPLAGRAVSRQVAADAAHAVDLLLRMHPAPGGSRYLTGYRSAFLARYGTQRRVPLLELLDPRFGLGPPGVRHAYPSAGGQHAPARRSERLLDLATTALRDGRREVVLDDADVEALTTWTPAADRLPPSLELSAFVLAASRDAVDRGDYTLVVGPNLGAQAAGRGLGRFTDLLGPPALDLLQEIADAEDTRLGIGVAAELVYLPARHRAANVAVRPALRRYEIPVGVAPGVAPEHVIAPDELAVLIRDGRLRLWWTAGGTEVSVSTGHMLNTTSAPQVCRFLHDIGLDGLTLLTSFDWGPAARLPLLPRVRAGRVVLRPAQWRQSRTTAAGALRVQDAASFTNALRDWRTQWRVPRYVYLAAGDNRLLLDLDDPAQAGQLPEELRRPRDGDLVLQEALPGPDDAWLPGPGGRYISELVIPLVRRQPTPASRGPTAPTSDPVARSAPSVDDEAGRLRPPGSDWLYLTLSGPRIGQDELVAGPLRRFAEAVVASGHADSWFFLRYSDPDPHLRLRLHGEPHTLMAQALPSVVTWAAGLIASGSLTRAGLEVYERELERYGGPEGIDVAEAIFAADSTATAALLDLTREPGEVAIDRVDLTVLSVDELLAGLGLDEAARLSWYTQAAPPPRESSAAYRERSSQLRALLGGDGAVLGPRHNVVLDLLAQRSAALNPLGVRLTQLHDSGRATLPVATLARSFVHLHCNRLGVDPVTERIVLGLLRRTRASLVAAPLRLTGTGRVLPSE